MRTYDVPAIIVNVSCHIGRAANNHRRLLIPHWGLSTVLTVLVLLVGLLLYGLMSAQEKIEGPHFRPWDTH